ncbi:hypothetical protein LCGC14_0413580 [marine sediment metagenome]|uniref:Baseplate protein J-like domain-containing protein n=1 Tax=marine sediment metagenome TaxID=412755 RepID=A0A0F9VEZ1_9ZZZZ
MVRIRSANEIILSLIDYYRSTAALLDTKPGTVTRDVIIDGPSSQLARLYEELAGVANLQSLSLTVGADLDRLSQNFGAVRQRGAKASGPVLFTFNNLDADIPINKGDIVRAKNGQTFVVLNSFTISTILETTFRATAARFRSDLDFVGITDAFVAEILVEATSSGIQGNISKYSITSTAIAAINNVTNASPFGGGRDTEDDSTFRNRVLAIFSGANTGTALGYKNAALSDPSVIDAIVIEPGDDLMTRDGTQVSVSSDGTRTITSTGTGGKVDVLIFGTRIQETVDSRIFQELSNTGDTTNSENDFVLGQIAADVNKTVARKRLDNLDDGTLPSQPVNSIVSVSGSLSGGNFVEKATDSLGRVTGNFEIVKDTGAFAGSPWAFDKLHWVDNKINDLEEDKTKIAFNGQDPLSFTDLLEINVGRQNIAVINENSQVSSSDRSSVQLAHFPTSNVTRVFNTTTGERYIVSNQNPDGSGSTNLTGRIVIRGQSLPAISDTLQVDYTWVFDYDPTFDFDNRATTTNPRAVQDSIDWGFPNAVRRERAILMASGSSLLVTVTHPISSIVSVNVFEEDTGTVTLSSGRLAFITSVAVTGVISIIRSSDGTDVYNSSDADGSFSGNTIFLPTDTVASFGDSVAVTYNATDVYNADTQGNFSSNIITIVLSAIATAGTLVEANYIANVSTLFPSTLLPSLPAIRSGNTFDIDGPDNVGTQPTTHVFAGDGSIVKNLRRAPSNLGLTISGSVSPGIITVTGTTLLFAQDVVYTVGTAGLKQNISSAVKSFLGLATNQSVPSNVKLARVTKVERVSTTSNLSMLAVLDTYDLRGYAILDNSFVKEESIVDMLLASTEVELPSTPDNLANVPSVGDRIRITFHVSTTADTENVSFSRSGLLYTNKRFALVDTMAVSSGFTSAPSAAATLTVTSLNQPITRSRYKVLYDYTAPKVNERITVRYNLDKLITDVTLAIENTRPINADVLVKASVSIPVNVTMNVVVTESFVNNTEIVRQNVQDAITSALNATALGTVVDSSDLINAAYGVAGVDRARILFFNKASESGSVLSIQALKNEFITANVVTITIETR